MKKVASITIRTITFPEKTYALFCLVKTVFLIVLSQLMRSMSKFALIAVGTISKLNEFLAEFQLLLERSLREGISLEAARGV